MKKLILIVSIAIAPLFAAQASNCKYLEAQFMGEVTAVRTNFIDQGVADCYITVDFNWEHTRPSGICPLGLSGPTEINAGPFRCEGTYEVGQEVSGYLNQSVQGGDIYLE